MRRFVLFSLAAALFWAINFFHSKPEQPPIRSTFEVVTSVKAWRQIPNPDSGFITLPDSCDLYAGTLVVVRYGDHGEYWISPLLSGDAWISVMNADPEHPCGGWVLYDESLRPTGP